MEPRKAPRVSRTASQNPAEFYALHEMMNRFRGRECGRKLAAALVRHTQNTADPLPEDL